MSESSDTCRMQLRLEKLEKFKAELCLRLNIDIEMASDEWIINEAEKHMVYYNKIVDAIYDAKTILKSKGN